MVGAVSRRSQNLSAYRWERSATTWAGFRRRPWTDHPNGLRVCSTQHAYELPAAGGDELARLADEAAGGEVVYLTRGGRRIAAIVPLAAGAAGMAALEALEDAEDERVRTIGSWSWSSRSAIVGRSTGNSEPAVGITRAANFLLRRPT